ncbi:MAG: isoprenylcysteine carboxylmethyltransferase family protein [Flavobacterium sp.]|nr:isoprenylcysteine carboxylmethyltransferase family protein [Flavobacterium sp.]
MNTKYKDLIFVGIQFFLFICFVFDFAFLLPIPTLFRTLRLLVAIIGLLIFIIAILQLNKNLSPFPTPKNNAHLIQNGLYKYVRHPIYSGIILLAFGSSFYFASVYKMSISFLLLILFHYKSKYEETLLQNKFSNYSKYKVKTGRFLPKIYSLIKL